MTGQQQESDEYDVRIGRNLQELRKANGLTQAELAARVSERGVPFRQQTIVKIEKGQRPLRLREADAIASALEVDVDLLTDEPLVIDDAALLVLHTRGVQEAWGGLIQAVEELLSNLSHLKGTLDRAGRREGTQIPDALLNEAATLLQVDPVEAAKGAVSVYTARRAITGVEYEAGVTSIKYERPADGEHQEEA